MTIQIDSINKKSELFVLACVFLCTLFVSLFGCTNNPFTLGIHYTDSSVFIYVAKVILNGGMPYRDTFDHKGPLIYLIDAAGLLIDNNYGIWVIELITIFSIFLFTYKIACLSKCDFWQKIFVMILGTIIFRGYLQGGNFVEEYACAFIIVTLYIFLKFFANTKLKSYEIMFCGMSLGAVCMLRINMAMLWPVMCLAVLVKTTKENKREDFTSVIKFFYSVF